MITILSPAKTLAFEDDAPTNEATQPIFQKEVHELVHILQQYSEEELGKLMNVSSKLASLNYQRYQDFESAFNRKNSKQALFAFKGDVYEGLEAEQLNEEEIQFANKHLRILSGLYGILRPLDLIQPYRLEMSTALANGQGKDLYAFWQDALTNHLNREINQQGASFLLNLASQEYFKAIKPKKLEAPIISPVFKEAKGGQYKVIALFAKKARGKMSRYVIQNRITDIEGIKSFQEDDYIYNGQLSTDDKPVFTRE